MGFVRDAGGSDTARDRARSLGVGDENIEGIMARHHVGCVLVVTNDGTGKLVGLLSRSDVLRAGSPHP